MQFAEEEAYPVDVTQVQAKISEKTNRGIVTCFTFAGTTYVTKQTKQGRRHTISGYEIHDKCYRPSLRDDLLRSLAQKQMKSSSLHKLEEEKKPLPEEAFNRQKSRRRSTLVTDVITAALQPSKQKAEQRRASLVSDVIKFDPKTTSSFAAGNQENWNTSLPQKLEIVKACKSDNRERMVPGGRESRLKEIAKLKYTSAARAAKMAYREAHISMETNRRLSFQGSPHYVTIPGVEKLPDFQNRTSNIEKNTSAKFKNWQKKFKIGLTPSTKPETCKS